MRAVVVRRGPAIAVVAAAESSDVDASDVDATDVDARIDTSYRAVPNDWRDAQERVIFKVNLAYGLDSGATSGEAGKNGFEPDAVTDPRGNAFDDRRQYLLGDAVLGTRGVLLPSMDTYFLSRYAFATNGASQFAALSSVYDQRDGRALLVRSAYAEIDDRNDDETLLGRMFVRAGRQFRYGSATFITNFDGISGGYDAPAFEASAFFGRRVSLFFEDDPGLLGGASIKVRGKDALNIPVDLAIDYLFFDGGGPADSALEDAAINLGRQYVELSARGQVGKTRLYIRGRLVDNGDLRTDENGEAEGFGLGRASLQARQPLGSKFLLVADVHQKFAREAAYDYISPAATDVLSVAESIGIGLDAPSDSTLLGLRASYMMSRALELYGFGRANLVSEDSTSGFNNSWQEGGAAVSHRAGRKLWSTVQYKFRFTNLDDEAGGVGSEFANTAGAGVRQFHEISADARYSAGYRKTTVAAGVYYRVDDLESPYALVEDDGRGGLRADADHWISKFLRAKLAGELAQASSVFAPELGTLFSVRLMMEAQF